MKVLDIWEFGSAVWNLAERAMQASARRYTILSREDREDLTEGVVERLLTSEAWIKRATTDFCQHGRLTHTKQEREQGADCNPAACAYRASRSLVLNKARDIQAQRCYAIAWSELPSEYEGISIDDLPAEDQQDIQSETIAKVVYDSVAGTLREVVKEGLPAKSRIIFDLILENPEISGAEIARTMRMNRQVATILLGTIIEEMREALKEII